MHKEEKGRRTKGMLIIKEEKNNEERGLKKEDGEGEGQNEWRERKGR
jgi:hypothetical protein